MLLNALPLLIVSISPYNGWTPVIVGTEVRLKSAHAQTCWDVYGNNGGFDFHTWQSYVGLNQKVNGYLYVVYASANITSSQFIIQKCGPIGFRIYHPLSDLYLAVATSPNDNCPFVPIIFSKVYSVVTFSNNNDGTCGYVDSCSSWSPSH